MALTDEVNRERQMVKCRRLREIFRRRSLLDLSLPFSLSIVWQLGDGGETAGGAQVGGFQTLVAQLGVYLITLKTHPPQSRPRLRNI